MKNIYLFLFLIITTYSNAQIVISQYVETSSGSIPKGIEIWNPSGADIDLSVTPITIFKGTNGAAPALDHTVNTGILKAGNIIVVGTSDMILMNLTDPCDDALYSLKAFTFNGDDALVLYLDGVIQDVFGTPGSDPGSAWTGGGVSTENSNIQLKTGITTGDLDGWTDPSERFETAGGGTSLTGFGQPTDGCPATTETSLNFDLSTSSINEDGISIDICVTITTPSETVATMVDIELDGASTATNGFDFEDDLMMDIPFPITLTFPANSSANQCLTIYIIDDTDVESTELIILNLSNPVGGIAASLGSSTNHELSILDNDTNTPTVDDIRINEVDCNTLGTDKAEFIELFGIPNYNMNGLILVLYNGNGDVSYDAIDLSGFTLDANGFFIIGGGVDAPGFPEISLGNDAVQNGADAVALYVGTPAEFPNGTSVTSVNMIDALVYDTNDADDSGLLSGLNQTEQIDENSNSNSDFESIQRGSWFVSVPTPRGTNVLPVKLTKLTVRSQGKSNLILWTTAVEINNEKFEIQHSSTGKDFVTIGSIAGHGDSYNEINYTFEDENPENGTNYYRLRQVDLDGKFEYTRILKIDNSKFGIDIHPFSTSTYLNITISEIESAIVHISNSDGTIAIKDIVNEGLNVIDVTRLSAGLHFITIISNEEKETHKFFKL